MKIICCKNDIDGVMFSVPASSTVDCGFKYQSGSTKNYETGICCFSTNHAALKSKRKDWLSQNQDNVAWVEQHVYLLTVVLVSLHYKNPIKRVGLVQSRCHHNHLIEIEFDTALCDKNLSVTFGRSIVFSRYSNFLYQ